MRHHTQHRGDGKETEPSATRTAAAGRGAQPSDVLRLQGAVGNAAVVQMLRRAESGQEHEEEHRHGAGCAHPAGQAAVQRSAVHDVLRSGGHPLDEGTRAEMESRLGADFSDVRIHDDSGARASADGIGARAYTAGHHVVIGEGGADRHTLAHELTHVIQQSQGPVAGTDTGDGFRMSDPADRFEREAESNARRVMRGPVPRARETEPATQSATQRAPGGSVQRWAAQQAPNQEAMQVSAGGLFAVPAVSPSSVWVKVGAPSQQVSASLRATSTPAQDLFGTGAYQEHELARQILDDCLHTAEEIMHDAVGELTEGVNSNIRTTAGTKPFGAADDSNRERAAAYLGEPDRRAAPVVGQAYLMIAMNPGETVMSQYHAAAVVGLDGADAVTLEAFAGSGQSVPSTGTYTVGSASSFHDYWKDIYYSPNYRHVTMKTVVIGRRGKGTRGAPGEERPANPNVA